MDVFVWTYYQRMAPDEHRRFACLQFDGEEAPEKYSINFNKYSKTYLTLSFIKIKLCFCQILLNLFRFKIFSSIGKVKINMLLSNTLLLFLIILIKEKINKTLGEKSYHNEYKCNRTQTGFYLVEREYNVSLSRTRHWHHEREPVSVRPTSKLYKPSKSSFS